MVQSSACRNPCQNFYDGKNELVGGISTKDSNRRTPVPVATRVPTPAAVPVIAFLADSGSADSSVLRYLEDNLQRIIRTVLDSRPLAPVPAPVVAAAPHFESPCEQPPKARFLNIY